MSAERTAEGLIYDMIRERDHYRARCAAAVDRIEREAGKVTDYAGNVSVALPVETWRSIRAMLQEEPPVTSRDEPKYECPNCYRVAEWTDGTSIAAGDERNEFWCQTCGAETPLEHCRPVAVSRRRRTTRRGSR